MNSLRNLFPRARWARLGSVIFLAVALAAPLLSVYAAGGSGGATEHDALWPDFFHKVVNFAVLAAVIIYFARRPLGNFLRGSAGEGLSSFLATRRMAEEAQAELEEQKKKIAGLEAELNRMVATARADAAQERVEILAEAEVHAERIKIQGRQQVDQEMLKARIAIRSELADQTLRLAEELIRARMDDTQRDRLVSEFIDQLGASR